MEKLKIDEAIKEAKKKGVKVLKKELANKIWPDRKQITQQVNMSSLVSGRTKSFTIEMIQILCEELDCTPNFLFNINTD